MSTKTGLTQTEDYLAFVHQRLTYPYALFDTLRSSDPVHWCEPLQCWLATRYEDVFALLSEPRLSANRGGLYFDMLSPANRELARPLVEHINTWMLPMDEPRHSQCRRLVSLAFTPRMIEGLRPMIERVVEELIEDVVSRGRVDFVQDFSTRLPAYVICEMLGLPHEDRDNFQQWADVIMSFSAAGGPELNQVVETAAKALHQLTKLFDSLIDERQIDPRDDLISAMLQVEQDGDRLTRDELFAMCIFLFIAGQDTTVGLLSNGMWLLSEHPDQLAKLQADVDRLVEPAVEECLRYESSVPRGVRRAREPFELHGCQIQQDQTVILLLGAANRDEAQFPNADRFDIERSPNKHVAFGRGPHFCLGAPLARLEAQIAFRQIACRKLVVRSLTDQPTWTTQLGLRLIREWPVEMALA
ncbi:MAG: cytochrome P450 [Pirellulaceae bacterium]|nr:cytochrome P450 [Pirellulaceae bacterium]